MTQGKRPSVFVRMFSSAVVDQAVLSAANLLVGVLLIRRSTDLEYGWYVLVWNALLLLTSMQNAFIGPPMVVRMSHLDDAGRGRLTASLFREQGWLYFIGAAMAAVTIWFGAEQGWMGSNIKWILLAGVVAAVAALHREMLRLVLNAYQRPEAVLGADIPYAVLLVGGAAVATLTPAPAATTVASLAAAAIVGYWLLKRRVLAGHDWHPRGEAQVLRKIAPLGLWSAAGAGIHWSFGQGYTYLVAAVLNVEAVAAIAAARLLMMPVNLLSTGIRSLMLPLTSSWLKAHGANVVVRRLILFSSGMACASLVYFSIMWLLRDWIFGTILNKSFAARDPLLLMWCGIFLLTVARDQLVYLLAARERFRIMAGLTFACALLSLLISYLGMLQFGQVGALLGMLAGEALSLCGIIVLTIRELRGRRQALAVA